jgi:hypothetical protein
MRVSSAGSMRVLQTLPHEMVLTRAVDSRSTAPSSKTMLPLYLAAPSMHMGARNADAAARDGAQSCAGPLTSEADLVAC